jgi:hypothetical protein
MTIFARQAMVKITFYKKNNILKLLILYMLITEGMTPGSDPTGRARGWDGIRSESGSRVHDRTGLEGGAAREDGR